VTGDPAALAAGSWLLRAPLAGSLAPRPGGLCAPASRRPRRAVERGHGL